MPSFFRVYTRVHMHFPAYTIKIIKNIYKNSLFSSWVDGYSGSSTTPARGQLFPTVETNLREYKSPSCAWSKGEREIIDIILCWYSLSKSEFPCLLHFPVHYRKPLFPGDAHLICTSSEGILARQGWDGSGRQSARISWKDSGDLSTRYFYTCYL